MAYRYLGVTHDAGTSRKTGRDYDICQVLIAVDARSARRQDRKAAFGYESEAFELDSGVLSQFGKIQQFSMVELQFEPNPRNPRVNWVTGVKPAQPTAGV